MSQQPELSILRIYTKDISFESPGSPQIFMENMQPKIDVRVEVHHNEIQENIHEVILEFFAEAKNEKGDVAFIIEIEQAGLFEMKNFGDADREHCINVFCATNLFPYVRQIVDQNLLQGSMPPLAMAPINFDAIYANRKRK
jgi:preprotein translocase subunit SecB